MFQTARERFRRMHLVKLWRLAVERRPTRR